jgi:hypothetical protein
MNHAPDWEQVTSAESGHVFYDAIEEGVRILVMRGPFHLCAYLGVPKDHPLAGFGYDDLPMQVHGGLTFGSEGKKNWPEGWYWYGWDYGHSGDYCTYYDDKLRTSAFRDGKKWTVNEVIAEAKDACYDFRKLMLLAEKCALKESGLLIARRESK